MRKIIVISAGIVVGKLLYPYLPLVSSTVICIAICIAVLID